MPEEPWPSMKAWVLLDQMETEPTDWSYIDLEKLLDLWGVTVIVHQEWNYRKRAHPDARDIEIGYPVVGHRNLHPETVKYACRALRTLERRLK